MIKILFFIHKVAVYLAWLPIAVAMALIAIIFAPVIVLFVDKSTGHLPYLLKWFETTDATMYDPMWVAEHPTWSTYRIALTWCQRNPAYGFCEFLNCRDLSNVSWFGSEQEPDDGQAKSGWFLLVSAKGYFQFKAVLGIPFTRHCLISEAGWQLKTPTHKTAGMYELAPLRTYNFGIK